MERLQQLSPYDHLIPAFLKSAEGVPTTLQGLAARWRTCRIEIRCRGAADLVRDFAPPTNIRGAWGHALRVGASAQALDGIPCPWTVPCTYDVFFNAHVDLKDNFAIPKPFVIQADRDGRDMLVRLIVFGEAEKWGSEAADALIRALKHGIDFRGQRRSMDVVDRTIEVDEGIYPARFERGIALDFQTQFAMKKSGTGGARKHQTISSQAEALNTDPASLLKSLNARVQGLARWHGLNLIFDRDDFNAEAEAVGQASEWLDHKEIVVFRRSNPQAKTLKMVGVAGILMMPPMSNMLSTLLVLGQTCHAGGKPALGRGRYRLLSMPG